NEAVKTITGQPPMFLRHLFPVHFQEEGTDLVQVQERLVAFIRNRRELIDQRVSLQVRKGSNSSWAESAGALKLALSEQLSDLPMELVV
ncbi:SAM-dependent methyltransferase, partial [Salinicoccus roseus]